MRSNQLNLKRKIFHGTLNKVPEDKVHSRNLLLPTGSVKHSVDDLFRPLSCTYSIKTMYSCCTPDTLRASDNAVSRYTLSIDIGMYR